MSKKFYYIRIDCFGITYRISKDKIIEIKSISDVDIDDNVLINMCSWDEIKDDLEIVRNDGPNMDWIFANSMISISDEKSSGVFNYKNKELK